MKGSQTTTPTTIMKTNSLSEVKNLIQSAQRIVLCTHVQPDGDALGSLIAAGMLLRAIKKDVTLICHDPVPQNLHILPGHEMVQSPDAVLGEAFDLAISLDASDLARTGDSGKVFLQAKASLVIDHHASNTRFGQYNYVVDTVAATGNLVYRLYEELGVNITPEAAACLYAALSTDTGNFSFGQMDEEFFSQMAGLIRAGLDINKYSRALHLTRDYSDIKLRSRALESLNLICEGRLSYMSLSLQDFEETGTLPGETEGLVNQALNITGVKMCFLATQMSENTTKFSLRALFPYKVSDIALEFGGGGHLLAAGCTLNLPLKEAVAVMLNRMRQDLCP